MGSGISRSPGKGTMLSGACAGRSTAGATDALTLARDRVHGAADLVSNEKEERVCLRVRG